MGLLEEKTAYIGFYSIKRNRKTSNGNVEYPIMVKVTSEGVEMCIPSVGWVPYSDGQLLLAQHSEKYTSTFNKTEVSQFLYANLVILKEEHIVLFTHGQNSRNLVSALNNKSIKRDEFEIKHDKLSVVRIRDQENGETFDWCSYSTVDGEYPKGSYPYSLVTGLFELNDRVFISIANKPGTASGMNPHRTKIEKPTQSFRRETAVEVTVAVCKEGISPLQLAKITHDLRKNTSIQYDKDMTIFPLPLHLAMKAKEYAMKI